MTDAELIGIAAGIRCATLARYPPRGMCFMVANPLAGLLRFYGMETRLVEGNIEIQGHTVNHFWIALPDGRVLDPTADQFNGAGLGDWPRIYLGAPKEIHASCPKKADT
ncbi:MAG: hypothetical protein ACFCUQ_22310 [Kiloniellales bacterium]